MNLVTEAVPSSPALSSWVLRGKQMRAVTPWLLPSAPPSTFVPFPRARFPPPNKHPGLGLEKLPTYNELHELDYDLG